ncbi:DUF1501 domain-containing protein [Flammeovirgaceae bacterium SG7u.111]|nr:DUF1501 domain-containing protein [Flammeovirgaceae bacterium SG7u.132]WPO37629.1 DUF1501 domain-containing protein [Flammeovirgaceae bacterium SG7u.111]
MKRRNFLKQAASAATGPFLLGGIPMHLFAQNSQLSRMAAASPNDKVLIILQMHGGNDGLNMVIPVDQYDNYYNLRPNIAIPQNGNRSFIELDKTIAKEKQVGLHPDMLGVKSMYDEGLVNIVQGVSYENNNGSHFRGRDIWFMGGSYDDYFGSGWIGRYLDHTYPGYPEGPPAAYPNATMPDPLGIEIGTGVSIAFHREDGIPAGLAVQNPQQFYDLINSVGGDPPGDIVDSFYGDELKYIMDIEKQSNLYAARLREVYENGSNSSVTYPETYPLAAPQGSLKNGLSNQLKLIARLLNGGIKTKVFLVRIGGFDTHASQVEDYDPTLGAHSALLYHISSAMKVFQDDLKNLGIDEKVLTMTYSEFGRRAKSNGSWGTDHGTAAPMMLFGKGVTPGIIGDNPDLANLDRNNVPMQYDYRQVLASVMQDWFEASDEALEATHFDQFSGEKLPVVGGSVTSTDEFFNERFRLDTCYPNPVRTETKISWKINTPANVTLSLFDNSGKKVKVIYEGKQPAGEHEVILNVKGLTPGMYFYRIKAGKLKASKKMVIIGG